MSKVQISEELFREVWLLLSFPDAEGWEDRRALAVAELDKKLNRIIDREIYTRYKTAPTPEQREAARKAYLERRKIPLDFRW